MFNYANGFTSGQRIQFFRNRGTLASPTAPQVGDEVGAFVFRPANPNNPSIVWDQLTAFGGIVSLIDASFTYTSLYFAAGGPGFTGRAQLYVHHTGRVAVGDVGTYTGAPALSEPQRSLDVFGDVRIRNTNPGVTPTQVLTTDANGDVQGVSLAGGFLMPRFTTAEISAIVSPQEGATLFNTDTKKLQVYDGTSWVNLH